MRTAKFSRDRLSTGSRIELDKKTIFVKQEHMMTRLTFNRSQAACLLLLCTLWLATANAQSEQRLSTPRNQSSQRYEINQTFDGQAFLKDNNIWVYNKEFAELFGMPAKYIEDVQGVAAAAFRIEESSYQECGFGGKVDACRKVQDCQLDLYFDESKTPLPWATDVKSQWLPSNSSMVWLRALDPKEKPHGIIALDAPPGVIRNDSLHSQVVAFADPVSKRQAIFVTNARTDQGGENETSGSLPLIGYMHNFYRQLSVVSLQLGCSGPSRPVVTIRLETKQQIYDEPMVRFNRITLSADFVRRIKELRKEQSERDAVFYRSLFSPPLGTRGTANSPVNQ